MTERGTLCVFAKPPRPGTVKTRLAAELGDERAATLARAFFADTWARVDVPWARRVIASTEPEAAAALGDAGAEVWLQGAGDLGDRLTTVLKRALAAGPWAIAVGADCPLLRTAALEAARAALDSSADAVLGPADDGGYYLLGVKRLPVGLLADLPWSSSSTHAATSARLRAFGLSVVELEPSFDVDTPGDLKRLDALLATDPALAPHTAAALGR